MIAESAGAFRMHRVVKSTSFAALSMTAISVFLANIAFAQTSPKPCPPAICATSDGGGSCAPPDADASCPIVGPVNNAPTISGSPAPAVNVGDSWSFAPTASDADGDTLTFSVENAPGWMSFDSTTGLLQGTPTAANAGVYDNIVITVSDGSLTASLGPFSVEVTQAALGSVALNWSLPTQYVDGSGLSDIATIKIHYGSAPGSYPNTIEITNTATVSYLVEDLVPDTYYFVMTIIDDAGVESDWSNRVEVTVE